LGTVGWIGSDQAVMPPAAFQIMLKPFSSQCAAATELAVDDEWFVLGQLSGAQK